VPAPSRELVEGADGAAVAFVDTFGWLLLDLGPLLLLPLLLPLLLSTCATASTCSGLREEVTAAVT
jgi:hypothetical protein